MIGLWAGLALASGFEATLLYPCAEGLHSCAGSACEAPSPMDGGPRVLPPAEVATLSARFPELRRDLEPVEPPTPDAQCREAFARYHALARRRDVSSAVGLYERACFEGDHIGSCHALRDLLLTQPALRAHAGRSAGEAEARRDLLLATARAHRAGREVRFEGAHRDAPSEHEVRGMTGVHGTDMVDWTLRD